VNLSNDDVQDILSLLDSLPYTELTLETSRFTLQLRRSGEGGWTQETQVLSQPVLVDPPPPATEAVPSGEPSPSGRPGLPLAPSGPGGSATPGSRPAPTVADSPLSPGSSPTPSASGADLRDVVSPLPGTFYRAPQPGAPPFVEAGGRVEAGTVVAIIETMKLMNPAYAGAAGTVTEICLDDGQFAEQGAILMRIRAAAG
jgi:acetyl-CoA carboxylase biotin carboxyl carrier protein